MIALNIIVGAMNAIFALMILKRKVDAPPVWFWLSFYFAIMNAIYVLHALLTTTTEN